MQRVAELVKERPGIVPGDQHGLARRALDEVRVVRADDGLLAVQSLVAAVHGGPGPRALARARKRIEVPQTDVLAGLLIRHLPDGDIGVEDRISYTPETNTPTRRPGFFGASLAGVGGGLYCCASPSAVAVADANC